VIATSGSITDEAAQRAQVAGDPGQQLPGWPAVVEADRKALQVLVEVPPQVGFDGQRRGGHRSPAEAEQHRLGDPEQQRQTDQAVHAGRLVAGDRTVDQGGGDQRQGGLHDHGQGGQGQHRDQVAAVGTKPGPEPDQVLDRGPLGACRDGTAGTGIS
jgi:hypothetical protein